MRTRGWRALVRLAWRDAMRAPGRSALIVAMIALPVFALTAADLAWRSAQLDPEEVVERRLGQTQAELRSGMSGRVTQAPNPDQGLMQNGQPSATSLADLERLAPEGSRVLTSTSVGVAVRFNGDVETPSLREVAYADPAFAGKFVELTGRSPRGPREVAASPALLEKLGARVGDDLYLSLTDVEVKIVGTAEHAPEEYGLELYAQPGAMIPAGARDRQLYIAGSEPVSWQDVLRLNDQRVSVFSRAVILDPPAPQEVPLYRENPDFLERNAEITSALAAVLAVASALLQVCLLAGAAFAVGAKRQTRALGMLAAAGAEPRHLRNVVLAGGLVLGTVAAVIGITGALAAVALARPAIEDLAGSRFGHFDVQPLEIAAIALVGVISGLLAAVVPARAAARRDPVAALRGRREAANPSPARAKRALALTAAGLLLAAAGALWLRRIFPLQHEIGFDYDSFGLATAIVLVGAALTQIGLILLTPSLFSSAFSGTGRLGRRLSLSPRLALRDAARNRTRSAPAVAAVLVAVAGAAGLIVYVSAQEKRDRMMYEANAYRLPVGKGLLELRVETGGSAGDEIRFVNIDAAGTRAALDDVLPVKETTMVQAAFSECGEGICDYTEPMLTGCRLLELDPSTATKAEAERARHDWNSGCNLEGGEAGLQPVGHAALDAVAPAAPSKAAAMLARGGVVVFDPRLIEDGHITFARWRGNRWKGNVSLPAVAVRTQDPLTPIVYSEAAARKLGMPFGPGKLLLSFTREPTRAEEEEAYGALAAAAILARKQSTPSADLVTPGLYVGHSYTNNFRLGLLALMAAAGVILLTAAAVTTGLTQADARPDHRTLDDVGAPPGLRKRLAAAQALCLTGMGAALGLLGGALPALIFTAANPSLPLTIPWLYLLGLGIGLPLLAGAGAWLLTSKRVPRERAVVA